MASRCWKANAKGKHRRIVWLAEVNQGGRCHLQNRLPKLRRQFADSEERRHIGISRDEKLQSHCLYHVIDRIHREWHQLQLVDCFQRADLASDSPFKAGMSLDVNLR